MVTVPIKSMFRVTDAGSDSRVSSPYINHHRRHNFFSVFLMLGLLPVLSLSVLLVHADVFPLTPPTQRAGQTCSITWDGDTNSTTNWKQMAIELMTGDNFNMIHLTSKTS